MEQLNYEILEVKDLSMNEYAILIILLELI